MTLLCFHPALAPYRVDYFNAIARYFDFHLVLLDDNLQEQKFNQEVLLRRMKCKVTHLLSGFVLRRRYIRTGFISVIRKEKPDVVLAYEYSPITLVILLYRMLFRKQFKLFTLTDDNVEMISNTKGVRRLLKHFVLKHADGALVLSDLVRSVMERFIGDKLSLSIVPIPLLYNPEEFRKDADDVFFQAGKWRRENLEAGRKLLAFVGRLAPEKNIPWLVERIAEPSWPSCVKVIIIGSGEEENRLKKYATKLQIGKDSLQFIGRKEGRELQVYFAAMDCLVLPSTSETFGAVVAEALYWGASVLVSNHVGAQSLVDKTNGAIFQLNAPKDFISQLEQVLANQGEWMGGRTSKIHQTLDEAVRKFYDACRGGAK